MYKNIIIIGLVLLSIVLLYFSRSTFKDNVRKENALAALQDSLRNYKTVNGSIGGYISTIQSDKNNLIALLNAKDPIKYQELIDSLKKVKGLQLATDIQTVTNTFYKTDIDTIFKGLKFTKNIKDDWIDETIIIDSNKLFRTLSYKDSYLITQSPKDNKGLFTGKTLTTYVSPRNPNTILTGITSISTIVDKRKPRLGLFIGPTIGINKQGNLSSAISVGFGVTF